jgi:hypothetical protein
VRLGCGISWADIESSDTTFWNWIDLRRIWGELWGHLDQAASEIVGSSTRAIPWAYSRDRNIDDVRQLIAVARVNSPDFEAPVAERRPDARMMILVGKTPAAIANTIGVLARGTERSYPELIYELSHEHLSDEDLLHLLDKKVKESSIDFRLQDESSFIPRQMVRAKMEYGRNEEATQSFSSLFQFLSEAVITESLSDADFLKALLRIAPEKSEIVSKALGVDLEARL